MLTARLAGVTALLVTVCGVNGLLYPRESESREVKSLDGVWNFRVCSVFDQDVGFREGWYHSPLAQTGDVIPMPVPSSFNDITQNRTIRDYVGWAWYDTSFFVPFRWDEDKQRVFIRFGSVHYYAAVFVNGISVVNHTGGHLPFEADVTGILKYGKQNLLTVAVNNTLTSSTIPQGSTSHKNDPSKYPPGFYTQNLNFDFFNYAGIHRSVVLYITPTEYIEDITVFTQSISLSDGSYTANVGYEISLATQDPSVTCVVTVLDKDQKEVLHLGECDGTLQISNAKLWWPLTMHPQPGYLYTLKVQLKLPNRTDFYYQKFGVRTVEVTNTSLLINGKPFYFMGFGKHEDANIRGKGLDFPLIIKDFNLIKWIGANSFRTSHYPYAEEIMDQADAQGIAVIDESPAVGLSSFSSTLLSEHKSRMLELITRDKNRPSAVMWSVANEPQSSQEASENYFKELVSYVKQLDPTRPVTAALSADYSNDKAGQFMDVIMHNNYFAWYSDTGSTEVITRSVFSEFANIHKTYQKPVMISEYGADTVAGLHMDPTFVFSEDFQTELLMLHHQAFDKLREQGFFIGEHIWNFADFMTIQQVTRVAGNRKGIFTRERQPKAAAKVLRCRYHRLVGADAADTNLYCPYAG